MSFSQLHCSFVFIYFSGINSLLAQLLDCGNFLSVMFILIIFEGFRPLCNKIYRPLSGHIYGHGRRLQPANPDPRIPIDFSFNLKARGDEKYDRILFVQTDLSGASLRIFFPGHELVPVKSHSGLSGYGVILPYLRYNSKSSFSVTDYSSNFATIEIPKPITAIGGYAENVFVFMSMGKPLVLSKAKIAPGIRRHV